MCVRMERRKPDSGAGDIKIDDPSLLADARAVRVYDQRILSFGDLWGSRKAPRAPKRRRRPIRDYITNNCEEALGSR